MKRVTNYSALKMLPVNGPDETDDHLSKGLLRSLFAVIQGRQETHPCRQWHDIGTLLCRARQRMTPGAMKQTADMQEVVSNLMISRIEVRGEEDADVAKYRHAIAREVRVVRPSQEVDAARHMLMHSFRRIMNQLAHSKVRTMLMQSMGCILNWLIHK